MGPDRLLQLLRSCPDAHVSIRAPSGGRLSEDTRAGLQVEMQLMQEY